MNPHIWMVIGLAMFAAGGIVHVFLSPYLSGEVKAQKRQAALRSTGPKRATETQADAASRRKQIAESLKDIETRGKRKRQSLEVRIAQSGLYGAATNISGLRLLCQHFLPALCFFVTRIRSWSWRRPASEGSGSPPGS